MVLMILLLLAAIVALACISYSFAKAARSHYTDRETRLQLMYLGGLLDMAALVLVIIVIVLIVSRGL